MNPFPWTSGADCTQVILGSPKYRISYLPNTTFQAKSHPDNIVECLMTLHAQDSSHLLMQKVPAGLTEYEEEASHNVFGHSVQPHQMPPPICLEPNFPLR
jgi:hypothetical protein